MTRHAVRWITLLLLTAAAVGAFAQDKVHWKVLPPASSKAGQIAMMTLQATIDEGWHLYGLKKADGPTATTIVGDGAEISGPITEGKPFVKMDPNFGVVVEYFEKSAEFRVPLKLGAGGLTGKLKVTFQSCNATICNPPKTLSLSVDGDDTANSTTSAVTGPGVKAPKVEDQGLLEFAGFAFVAGFLALLTPCVFPMVPITVSFFTKQREKVGPKAGIYHAVAYCLGIISAFTAFGILVTAVFGASGIQRFATNPWVNAVLAVIFVLLALNLFGIFELSLPSGLQNAFSPQGKAGFLAPLMMGLTFTLTSFTCTVPFVGTILVSAAKGDYLYPLIGMLSFSTAFSLPFFLLALFPQFLAKLPRSGSWLEMVKAFMGFLEVAAAVKFLSNADLVLQTNLISRSTFLIVWAVVLLCAVGFLLGRIPVGKVEVPKQIGLGRWIAIVASATVAISLLSSVGGRSLGELEAFLPPTAQKGWQSNYEQALTVARQTNRPVLINFTGVTCTNCRWMEKNIFPRPDVVRQLKNYVLVELYTDRQNAEDTKNGLLQQQLTGSVTLPAYVAVSPEGKVKQIFPGSTREPKDFVGFLKAGLS